MFLEGRLRKPFGGGGLEKWPGLGAGRAVGRREPRQQYCPEQQGRREDGKRQRASLGWP